MKPDEQKMPEENLDFQEAPASATVKIKSPNNFEYMFTIRSDKASTLMFKIHAMETKWMKEGFTPLAQNQGFSKREIKPIEYAEGTCPVDGARLIKGMGKIELKCENYKYDMKEKKNVG